MDLRNLRHAIDATIFRRGQTYLQEARVSKLKEKTDGLWTARVAGSGGAYHVTVVVDGMHVDDWACDCPYDDGPVCKHVVAVLLEIAEREGIDLAPLSKPEQRASMRMTDAVAARLERARSILSKAVGASAAETKPVEALPPAGDSAEEFLAAYAALPVLAQRLVKIAVLAWEALPAQKFIDIYRNTQWPAAHEEKTTPQRLQEVVDALVAAGYLTVAKSNLHLRHAWIDAWIDAYLAADGTEARAAAAAIQRVMTRYWYDNTKPDRLVRDLRLTEFFQSPNTFIEQFRNSLQYGYGGFTRERLLGYWLGEPFDAARFERRAPAIRAFLLAEALGVRRDQFLATAPLLDHAVALLPGLPDDPARAQLQLVCAEIAVLQLDVERLTALAPLLPTALAQACTGAYHLLHGEFELAAAALDEAQRTHRRATRAPQGTLPGLFGLFTALARLAPSQSTHWPKLDVQLGRVAKNIGYPQRPAQYLRAVAFLLTSDRPAARTALAATAAVTALDRVFFYLAAWWVDDHQLDLQTLAIDGRIWAENAYAWPARLVAQIAGRLQGRPPATDEPGVLDLIPRHEAWENALLALLRLADSTRDDAEPVEGQSRMAWFVDFERLELYAKEQTYGKKGWTSGRTPAEDRLLRGEVPGMTAQDKRIAAGLSRYYLSRDGNYSIGMDREAALRALVDHPHLYRLRSPDVPVQLVAGELPLLCEATPKGFRLSFPFAVEKPGLRVIKENPSRYQLIEVTEQHVRVARAFDGPSVTVPEAQRDRLQLALGGLARLVPVQSAIDPELERLPRVEADARPHVHILPVGELYQVELFVKPLGSNPPYFRPGEGPEVVIGMREDARVRTDRDLKAEAKHARELCQHVATLRDKRADEGIRTLNGTAECLEFLLELHPHLEAGAAVLEWPKGEKMRVSSVMAPDQFRVRVNAASNWFEVDGALAVDENRVVGMQELLAWSDKRFVEIEPGRFLALTDELRRRLQAARGLLTGQGDTRRLHPLAATAFEQAMEGLPRLEVDAAFRANLQRLKTAFSRTFELPDGFQARLRPYQYAGFEWLQRCAEACWGACLADDMGLGKTVQALAMLLSRAPLGPALVVAPASVCRNWVAETQKFAPTLRPLLFGAGDRAAMLDEAGPGDLVIVTYDLLAREAENFTAKKFATAILDEAQAIKNRTTKRSATVMALQADYRVIMTGTPVENHLGELWNLFHFANPGLLGSIEHFTDTYSIPIEKYGDHQRREELRRLVQPFILRRRKDDVLRDLPAKTEITLHVEPAPDEHAFYEALRRKAVEALTDNESANAGERHLRILAELMRLRRAACHPALVEGGSGFSSSAKLRQFEELVVELQENGHKALVFSQFVDHLKLLEKVFKKQKIAYQYLDGSTPLATRQKRIDAFQRGEGDFFLISLKAGGVGLNLTAADYVIHMDPWWNPAVEDQATDRAHRIGQEKPVTVYRIVAAGTIEEKILQLHDRKRDLADALLAGTDRSARLSAEELLELLKTGV